MEIGHDAIVVKGCFVIDDSLRSVSLWIQNIQDIWHFDADLGRDGNQRKVAKNSNIFKSSSK